jgi:hypothetical protein
VLERTERVWVALLVVMLVVAFAVLVWLVASLLRWRAERRDDG